MAKEAREDIFLSVIVPSYKESERIRENLEEIKKFLVSKEYASEVVVVVDGSPDDTAQIARAFEKEIQNFRVIENPENHGKGYVVRQGLLEAQGKYRVFLDADGSTSITHADRFLEEFEYGYDIVIGSRDVQGAYIQVHQPRYRELMGNMGNWLIRIVLGLWKFPDTQCGFKMYSAQAAEAIASRAMVDRFGFDFEMISIGRKIGFRIRQLPVRWLNEEGSTVKLFGKNGFTQVLLDLFKVRMRLWLGKYKIKEYKTRKQEVPTTPKTA